jgi:hypothetical protein
VDQVSLGREPDHVDPTRQDDAGHVADAETEEQGLAEPIGLDAAVADQGQLDDPHDEQNQ